MRLRFSMLAASVAGTYALLAGSLALAESIGHGCMGWCFAVATLPEWAVLGALPTEFFYSPLWEHLLVFVFAIGAICLNAFIVYVIFAGVKWGSDE
ncbi:MAG: hypothetical protein JHC40_20650 [Burkholderiales bacterium]|nr:hypothetical protein [Burkholderiales bacterium]